MFPLEFDVYDSFVGVGQSYKRRPRVPSQDRGLQILERRKVHVRLQASDGRFTERIVMM